MLIFGQFRISRFRLHFISRLTDIRNINVIWTWASALSISNILIAAFFDIFIHILNIVIACFLCFGIITFISIFIRSAAITAILIDCWLNNRVDLIVVNVFFVVIAGVIDVANGLVVPHIEINFNLFIFITFQIILRWLKLINIIIVSLFMFLRSFLVCISQLLFLL